MDILYVVEIFDREWQPVCTTQNLDRAAAAYTTQPMADAAKDAWVSNLGNDFRVRKYVRAEE